MATLHVTLESRKQAELKARSEFSAKSKDPAEMGGHQKWQIWQRMTRVLGTMAQVGLAQIGQSPPPRADLHNPRNLRVRG